LPRSAAAAGPAGISALVDGFSVEHLNLRCFGLINADTRNLTPET
jgi:hypothetical protein